MGVRRLGRRRVFIAAIAGSLIAGVMVPAVTAPARATAPPFTAHGSVEQVYVTGAAPGASMSLISAGSTTLYTQPADSLGGLLFRNVPPGSGYRVRDDSAGAESAPLTVHDEAAAQRAVQCLPGNHRSHLGLNAPPSEQLVEIGRNPNPQRSISVS